MARKRTLPTGRDGARPLRRSGAGRCVQDGGVRSPRPTGATQVVPSSGPMWASAPTDRRGSLSDHPGQRRAAKRPRPRPRRNGWESQQRSPQKGPATPDNPSVTAAPCQLPLHKGAFRTGDADCRVASLLAMTVLNLCHSEEAQRADVGIRPFYDGRGFGPPSRRPLRVVAESRRNHPGSALSAEREAGQIRSLPDDLGVQHGVQGSEV